MVAPLLIALTVLMWTTLPLWLVGAGDSLSPFVPGLAATGAAALAAAWCT